MSQSIEELLQQLADQARVAGAHISEALRYATSQQKDDPEFVSTAIQQHPHAFQYASPRLRDDNNFVTIAIRLSSYNLHFASPRLQDDKDIVMLAVQASGINLQFASSRLQNDTEVVMAAVTNSGLALQYTSQALQRDRKLVRAAVTNYGLALQYTSPELQHDRDLVLAAILQNGNALQFASKELRHDRHLVLLALKSDGELLQYAASELQADPEVALTAIQNTGRALRYVNLELLKNPEFVDAALLLLQIPDKYSYRGAPINSGLMAGRENTEFESQQKLISSALEARSSLRKRVEALEQQVKISNKPASKDPLSIVQSERKSASGTRVDPQVLRKQQRFNTYIEENAETLQLGQWLSFTDDSPNPRLYTTYQEASKSNRHRPGWFCDQFRGRNPEPYEIDSAEGRFYRLNRLISTEAAYVDVHITNPQTRASLSSRIKLDPGADMTYSDRRDIKNLLIPVHSYNHWSVGIGGRVDSNKHEINIQVGDLPPMTILVSCPTEEEKTDGKWLLGQNYLQFCKHTWTNKTKVEIQPLDTFIPSPDPGDSEPTASSAYLNEAQNPRGCQIT